METEKTEGQSRFDLFVEARRKEREANSQYIRHLRQMGQLDPKASGPVDRHLYRRLSDAELDWLGVPH